MSRAAGRPGRSDRSGTKSNDGRGLAAPPARVSEVRPLRREHLAFAAIVTAACVLIGVTHLIYETDVWEHLLVGKVFWSQHRVFTTSVWSWPAYGTPNVNPSWGFSALLWPFWTLGGVMGLELWRWLTTLTAFALPGLTARRLGARGLALFLVLAITALVYRQRVQIRPETLAGVWFALSLLVLETARARERPALVWSLVPIAWVWANSHISFYLLFVLLAFHTIDAAFGRRGARVRPLVAAGAASLAIALVNPFGWRTLATPVEYLLQWRHEPFFAAISELRPVVWSQNWSNGLPLLLAGWPALLIARARRGRVDRVECLMALFFTVEAFSSARFVATYALAAAPYVARDLDEALALTPRPASPWARTLLVSSACVLLGLFDWTRNVAPLGLGLDTARMPVSACDWIAVHGVRGRAMNHFPFGGYLLWRFWPDRDRLPFFDIHADGPRDLRDAYARAMSTPDGWRALDGRFHFDWALFSRRYADRPGLLDTVDDDERWTLVFVDDVAALYLRREGRMAPLAERWGYRTLGGSRVTMAARAASAAREPALRAEMLRELARQAQESRVNFYGRAMTRALQAR